MKKTLYAEPVIEVIDIDANIICTSSYSGCSAPNQLEEIEDDSN